MMYGSGAVSSTSPEPDVSRFSLKQRLVVVVLLVGLVPVLLATGIAHHVGRENLQEAAFSKLVALRDARAAHIRSAYRTIAAQIVDRADSCTVRDALSQMTPALRELPAELGWTEEGAAAAAQSLRAYYRGPFADRYAAAVGGAVDTDLLVPTADWSVALQSLYLSANPEAEGEKQRLDRPAGDDTAYGAAHAEHHPLLRGFLERFGFYDIFLVDTDAVVVYSVLKEIDLGTDLEGGPHRDSGLARAAREALEASAEEGPFLVDYTAYVPSYQEPAAFLAAPVFAGSRRLGALVFQMPIGRLNAVMTNPAGMGETGETYLVGRDLTMRSDSRFDAESSILRRRIDTPAARQALEGRTGHDLIEDDRGVQVLAAWMPLDVQGLRYALIAEMDAEEAFAPAERLFRWLLGIAVGLGLIALLASFVVASSLARPIGRITERLESLAQGLLSESQDQQAGASEQSAAVEETRQTYGGLLQASTDMQRIGGEVLGHAEVSQQSAQTIGERIRDLSGGTVTINEIVNLVKEIANKSEILALNAALEGTKAGEAGRGFSLVAQQMQRLAEQVMDSVKRIEGLTGGIADSSRGAVLAAEEASKVSRLTTDAAREIAAAVAVQQSSAEQISVAMDEIAQVATRNVEAARGVVSSSNDLLKLAERLRRTVGVRS